MMVSANQSRLRGELRLNEPMSRHTTWRVGGPARIFYRPADVEDLCTFLQLHSAEPILWLGLGSNLLVRDGGIPGVVISTQGALDGLEQLSPATVRAEAGVSCAKLARFCAKRDLVGAEFLAGIPGTVGGALAMNAGAFGGETWQCVSAVETVDRAGRLHTRKADEFEIGYRNVRGPEGEWFVAAHLQLHTGNGLEAQARIKALLDRRNESQPIGLPSCGSVFRNPKGDYAARLIEAAGLKGTCIGNACVSEKHANFIINTGGASADDIEHLVAHVADVVEQTFGVRLEREVRIAGATMATAQQGDPV